jgi:hypothetical protein
MQWPALRCKQNQLRKKWQENETPQHELESRGKKLREEANQAALSRPASATKNQETGQEPYPYDSAVESGRQFRFRLSSGAARSYGTEYNDSCFLADAILHEMQTCHNSELAEARAQLYSGAVGRQPLDDEHPPEKRLVVFVMWVELRESRGEGRGCQHAREKEVVSTGTGEAGGRRWRGDGNAGPCRGTKEWRRPTNMQGGGI